MGQIFEELKKAHPGWTDKQVHEKGWKILETRKIIANMFLQYRNR